MPKGPNGERRPGDTIGMSVMIGKIAAGQVEGNKKSNRTKSGKARARAKKLTVEERMETARKAANVRWG